MDANMETDVNIEPTRGNGKKRTGALLPLAALTLAALAVTLVPAGEVPGKDLPPSEKGDNRVFPHVMHVEDFELSCLTCHKPSPRPEETVLAADPQACQDCHDRSDVAPYFPVGSYHGPGFRHLHQFRARAEDERCTRCHEGSESCTTCHQGENIDLLVHPRNYLFMHPVEAKHNETDCQACHSPADFCTACHAQEGVMPGSHRVGGWRSGPVHGAEARRDVTSCAVCHSTPEPVCLDCHDAP